MAVLKINLLSRSNFRMGRFLGESFVEYLAALEEFHYMNLEETCWRQKLKSSGFRKGIGD